MMTYEQRYEYVMKRCDELAAARRKKRITAAKIVAPVCAAATITGIFAVSSRYYPFLSEKSAYVDSAHFSLLPDLLLRKIQCQTLPKNR